MARKNRNAERNPRRFRIRKGKHFVYEVPYSGEGATVVRYLGEQNDDTLLCYHPEGYTLWIHVDYLTNVLQESAR